ISHPIQTTLDNSKLLIDIISRFIALFIYRERTMCDLKVGIFLKIIGKVYASGVTCSKNYVLKAFISKSIKKLIYIGNVSLRQSIYRLNGPSRLCRFFSFFNLRFASEIITQIPNAIKRIE